MTVLAHVALKLGRESFIDRKMPQLSTFFQGEIIWLFFFSPLPSQPVLKTVLFVSNTFHFAFFFIDDRFI